MNTDRISDEPVDGALACAICGFEHEAPNIASHCPSARVGELLAGRYRLLSILGIGGMGVVYEARHELVGRRFAVKLLHAEVARQPSVLNRFRREAEAAGALKSEHIAAVTDFGATDDGVPFIVMEHLEGLDLAKELQRQRRLPHARAAEIAVQVCRALAVAHAHGIVHCDLKPENLFLCLRGEGGREVVKLLDFGIAKLHPRISTRATATRAMLGTPHYMPPEQARGRREVDHRTDIYALGAVLYEMLSGELAHPGETPQEVIYHVTSQPPAPLSSLRPELPPGLIAVVERAMALNPDDRFAHVDDMMDALAPYARGDGVVPARGMFSEHASMLASAEPPGHRGAFARKSLQSHARRRRSGWRSLASVAALCVLVAAAAVWWRNANKELAASPPAAAAPTQTTQAIDPAPPAEAPAPPSASVSKNLEAGDTAEKVARDQEAPRAPRPVAKRPRRAAEPPIDERVPSSDSPDSPPPASTPPPPEQEAAPPLRRSRI